MNTGWLEVIDTEECWVAEYHSSIFAAGRVDEEGWSDGRRTMSERPPDAQIYTLRPSGYSQVTRATRTVQLRVFEGQRRGCPLPIYPLLHLPWPNLAQVIAGHHKGNIAPQLPAAA